MEDIATFLFVLDFVLNTFIILLDTLIICTVVTSRNLRCNSVMVFILFAMLLDVLIYINTFAHDLPSYFLNEDFTTTFLTSVSTVVLCTQWFSQLLILPVLSVIHLMAAFAPVEFRRINRKHIAVCIIVILIIDVFLTAPLFSWCCGYVYLIDGHFWYFDFQKPYTYIYSKLNIILQAICIGTVLSIDVLIVYKVYKLQKSQTWMKSSVSNASERLGAGNVAKMRIGMSREARLAVNFVFLTMCFVVMSACFNIIGGHGVFQDLLTKLSTNVNYIKWAIYSLGISEVRRRLLRIIGFKNGSGTTLHTFTRAEQ